MKTYEAVPISADRQLDYYGVKVRRRHGRNNVELSRFNSAAGVPWMADHSSRTGDQIGSTARPRLRGGRLLVDMTTDDSVLGDLMEQRIDSGMTTGVSVDWQALDGGIEQNPDGSYDITRWEVLHVASTPIPRNPDLGFAAQDSLQRDADGNVIGGRDTLQLRIVDDNDPAAGRGDANQNPPQNQPQNQPAPAPAAAGAQDSVHTIRLEVAQPAPTAPAPANPAADAADATRSFATLIAVADSYSDQVDEAVRNKLLVKAISDGMTADGLDALLKAAQADAQGEPTPAQPPVPQDAVVKGGLDKLLQSFQDSVDGSRCVLPRGDMADAIKANPKIVSDAYRSLQLARGGQDALTNTTANAANQFAHTVDSFANALIEMSALRGMIRTFTGVMGEYQRPAVGRIQTSIGTEGVVPTDQTPVPGGLKLLPDYAVLAGLTETRAMIRTWTTDTVAGILSDFMAAMVEQMDESLINGTSPRGFFKWRASAGQNAPNERVPATNIIAKADLAAVTYESLGELLEALLDQKAGDMGIFWLLSNSVYVKGLVSPRFTNGRDGWFDGDMLLGKPHIHSSFVPADKAGLMRGTDVTLAVFDDDIVMEVNTLDSVNYVYKGSQMYNFGTVHPETWAFFK